ncbi:MAG: hypothetical protein ACREDM_08975 [Methylocella sp.]
MAGVAVAAYSLDRWQNETIGKRKAELAAQALTTFDEVRDVFRAVRSPNFLDNANPACAHGMKAKPKPSRKNATAILRRLSASLTTRKFSHGCNRSSTLFPLVSARQLANRSAPSRRCVTTSGWPLTFSSAAHRKTRLTMIAARISAAMRHLS